MRIGISTYTYPWAIGGRDGAQDENLLPVTSLLEQAASMPGVEVLQICDRSGPECLTAAERQAVSCQAGRAGICIQIGSTGIAPGHLMLLLETAISVQADLVRTILPFSGHGSGCADAAAMIREIIPAFEQANILLSLENHDRTPSRDLRAMVDGIASPVFGICLDPVNSFGIGEDTMRVLDTLVPVANCFHAKDYRIRRTASGLGFLLEGTPAGQGMLGIPAILDRFAKAGVNPDVIIELWPPFQKDIGATIALEQRWAVESVSYLNRLMAGR